MGPYIDPLRLVAVGLILAGAVAYALIFAGIGPVVASVTCIVAFFVWAVIARRVPGMPGHAWFVALSSPSIPQSSSDTVRKLLRVGAKSDLCGAGQPVVEGAKLLQRWIQRNLQWSAGVAMVVALNGRWLVDHQVPAGSAWALGAMALGVALQVIMQLWFLQRARYILHECGAA